ncbi:MAG: sporulation membrane protein YtaF [Bacillota bacterium]
MDLIGALLLVLAVNIDSLGVGISLGAKKIRVPLISNVLIASITSFGTLAALLAGQWLSGRFSSVLGKYIGCMVISGMGIWVIYDEVRRRKASGVLRKKEPVPEDSRDGDTDSQKLTDLLLTPPLADSDYSGHIDIREACLLGGALTLNNFAGGFGAGFLGLRPVFTSFAVAFISLLLLWCGLKVGENYISRWLGGKAGTAAGVLLILIGGYQLFI